jgi:exodeoxyribonuclease VII small subunit
VNDTRDTYETAKARLEEISTAARAKDVTLEKSIELLEEAVRLANLCTEHVDQVGTFVVEDPEAQQAAAGEPDSGGGDGATGADVEADTVVDQYEPSREDSEPDVGETEPLRDGSEPDASEGWADDAAREQAGT